MLKSLLVVIAFCFSGASYSHEISQPHIDVFGSAKEQVVPNVMNWNLKVENKEASLEGVSEKHSKIVSQLLKVIESKGVVKKTIQTSGMSFGENIVYRDRSRVQEGYLASTVISFKLTNFKQYQPLWLALSQINGVSVSGVSYDYKQRIELQNKVRQLALLAAKEKAQAMAETLNLNIGDAISISEIDNSYSGSNRSNVLSYSEGAGQSSSSVVAPGTISISMKVKLVMSLVAQ